MPNAFSLVALLLTISLASIAHGDPTVTFAPTSFAVSNVSPGGKIMVCGVGDSRVDGSELISKQSAVIVADANGHLDVKIDHPAFRSIWLIVDLKADTYLVATPPGYRAVTMHVAPSITSNLDVLNTFRPLSFIFVAHAPLGAWETFAGDGSASDDDKRADGKVTAALHRFTPIGDSPPSPAHLTPGDIVLTVDPSSMTYAAFRVPKGGSGAP